MRQYGLSSEDLVLRPLPELFDVNGMSMPSNPVERIRTNFSHYAANYIAIILLSYLIVGFFYDNRFGMLLAATLASTLYLSYVRTAPVYIFQTRIGQDESRYVALFAGTAALLYFKSNMLLRATAIPAILILLHSAFRSRTLKSRGTTFVQDVKSGRRPM